MRFEQSKKYRKETWLVSDAKEKALVGRHPPAAGVISPTHPDYSTFRIAPYLNYVLGIQETRRHPSSAAALGPHVQNYRHRPSLAPLRWSVAYKWINGDFN